MNRLDIKIVDVAARAGVSTATVSRVFNHSTEVTAKTKQRVMQAIEELGYHPNATAKNLRSQKTLTIAVIVPDINVAYFTEIIKGIENMAYLKNYKLLICDAENQKSKELDYLNLLMNRTVDAAILIAPLLSDDEIRGISDQGYIVAVIGRYLEHKSIPCIYTDNIKFSLTVMRHLFACGHRDIVFLSGYADSIDSIERQQGYKQALQQHDLPYRPELIESGDFNERGGYEAIHRLLGKGVTFSAVFAANDEMALGVYKACREHGLSIPEQVAVVGVDNNRISEYISPAMSTVNQPKYTMGIMLAEKLIDLMNDNEFADKRSFKVNSELLIRASSNFIREV